MKEKQKEKAIKQAMQLLLSEGIISELQLASYLTKIIFFRLPNDSLLKCAIYWLSSTFFHSNHLLTLS